MRIAITDNFKPKFENYVRWLKRGNENVDILKLSHIADNLDQLDRYDGLVLTGGGDVDPQYYQGDDPKNHLRDVDSKRDDFEIRAIERALSRETPTLGICRGLQVANVALGGSLIGDLVSCGYRSHRTNGDHEMVHPIQIETGSRLAEVIGGMSGEVNSAHHQAADRIGRNLKVSARSPDGVVEALEWANRVRTPFLLLVQWHPERIGDLQNPASRRILQTFLYEVESTRQKKHRSKEQYHGT